MKIQFKILIIDLHHIDKKNDIYNFFKNNDYETHIHKNKNEVFSFLNINKVDLIIINTNDMDNDSKEILNEIRKKYSTNVLYLTNNNSIIERKKFMKFNLLDYKIKNNNLINTLNEINNLITNLIHNKNETILIIKRDNQTRTIIINLLKQKYYNVIVSSNEKEAWAVLKSTKSISLILLDISMKDINSKDLIDFSKNKFNKNIPVLALTSEYDPLMMQQNIEYGLNDFIILPIVHEEFNLKIDLWIKNIKQQLLLEQNFKNIQALSNATIEGLFLFNENNYCVNVNDAAVKLFEYSNKEELNNKNILEIVSPNITEFDKNELLKNNVDHEFELLMIKKNNNVFPAQIKEKNILLDNKQVKIIAVLDLTDIKKKEKMLAQQSKMASMGEMIGNIAHQWRQPLSSISIAASNIKVNYELDMVDEEEMFESLDGIVNSTQFLSETIDNFRDFIKGDSLKYSFKIADLINKVLKLVEGNINSGNIKVIQNHEDIELYTYGNELIQVMLNIINNARDALITKDIKPKYIFINTNLDIKTNKLIISIQDNADGIPNDVLPKIFEPYFTTKHKSQGTGLGLYMTHQMINEHLKGEIEVLNNEFNYDDYSYKGALFKIKIPL